MRNDPYLDKLKAALLAFFARDEVKILLFGSRARGDNARTSDVDIGLLFESNVAAGKLAQLKEEIEDLNIPYKVEIVNLAATSPAFRRQALKDAVAWKG